jgi:hypothetical protein
MAEFYRLCSPRDVNALTPALREEGDRPYAKTLLFGGACDRGPLLIRKCEGGKQYDHIYGAVPFVHLVSSRMVEVLVARALSGWVTYPIAVRGADKRLFEGYSGLGVTGRAGPEQPERSVVSIRRSAPRRGVFFDEASWDGSDFFLAGTRPTVMLGARAVERLMESNLSGFHVKPTSEIETGHFELT